MPIPENRVPKIRHHKRDNTAVADFYDPGNGRRRQVTLGPWNDQEAVRRAYARLLSDIETARVQASTVDGVTVAELAVRFLKWADSYYRQAGRPTAEIGNFRGATAVLIRVAGDLPARQFGPRAIAQVRDAMVAAGWARTTVNNQTRRVKQIFRWAVESELVEVGVWQALLAVRGLGVGRTSAPEPQAIRPAPEEAVEAAIHRLPPPVAAMVRFQLLTGCRPQDVCNLTGAAIDRTGDVWVYRPAEHKTRYRGKVREIWIGPRAQQLLAPWLDQAEGGPVFSPRRWVEQQHAERTAARKTPRYPSHMRRNQAKRVAKPKRPPLERYTTASYGRAIERACDLAGVARWSPNQLRHAAATRFRAEFGLEQARVLLGHNSTIVTEIYAEIDRAKAAEAMRRVG